MEFETKNKTYKAFMLIITTALITFLLTSIGMYNFFTRTKTGSTQIMANYMEPAKTTDDLKVKMEMVKRFLQNNYIGELDENKMLEYALKGYVEGLDDKYTEYLTKTEYDDLLIAVKGNYVGIGVYMAQSSNGEIIILLPIEGSPAEEVRIKIRGYNK